MTNKPDTSEACKNIEEFERNHPEMERKLDELLLFVADNYPARYMRFVTKEMMIKYT